jgi:lactate dehydrogenase-like 2-hydroxyacid dehydrogenase
LILGVHTASAEKDTTEEMARLCIENVAAVLSGQKPLTPVN